MAEEYVGTAGGAPWCTLTVTLPGRVPFLVADNDAANGRSHVPMEAPHFAELDDPPFDATYAVGGEETWLIQRVLTPSVRALLVANPVQRLMLRESLVLVRTFDGVELDDDMIAWLTAAAQTFLSSTPAFTTPMRAAAGNPTLLSSRTSPCHRVSTGRTDGLLRSTTLEAVNRGGEWSRLCPSRQGKRAEDRIADLVKKAMQNKTSADSHRADFALAA